MPMRACAHKDNDARLRAVCHVGMWAPVRAMGRAQQQRTRQQGIIIHVKNSAQCAIPQKRK
eukprot:scaffold23306_cov125-Isochrysis_galbana.AAC.1